MGADFGMRNWIRSNRTRIAISVVVALGRASKLEREMNLSDTENHPVDFRWCCFEA